MMGNEKHIEMDDLLGRIHDLTTSLGGNNPLVLALKEEAMRRLDKDGSNNKSQFAGLQYQLRDYLGGETHISLATQKSMADFVAWVLEKTSPKNTASKKPRYIDVAELPYLISQYKRDGGLGPFKAIIEFIEWLQGRDTKGESSQSP